MSKLLVRSVPSWSHERTAPWSALTRDVARRFGASVAESARPLVESAPLEKLASAWHRLPYVEQVESMFDPGWTLDLRPLSKKDLLRHAFGEPLPCGVLLEVRARRLAEWNRLAFLTDVPWFMFLKGSDLLAAELISQGWMAFMCANRSMAEALREGVRGKIVRCTVLGACTPAAPR